MLLTSKDKDILDNPVKYIQGKTTQNSNAGLADEELFSQMDKALEGFGYNFAPKNEGPDLKQTLINEDPDRAKQYEAMGPIPIYEGAKREALEQNGIFEFSGKYDNVIQHPSQIIAEENFKKKQEEIQRKRLERNKRVNEGTASFNERVDAFFDRMAQSNIKDSEQRFSQNAYNQEVGQQPNTRARIAGVDRTGQIIYDNIDLSKKIGFLEAFRPAVAEGTAVGSSLNAIETKKIREIKDKMIEGKPIYQHEFDMVNRHYESEKEKQIRGYSVGGQIGGGLGKSLGFSADFIVGGAVLNGLGVGALAGNAGLKTYLGAKEIGAASGVAKGLATTTELGVKGILGSAVMTAVNSPLRLFPEYQERMLGNEAKLTDSGNMIFQESTEKQATAIFKSLGSLYIAYLTELVGGEALSAVGKSIGKGIGAVGSGAVGRMLSKNPALNNFMSKSVTELSKRYEALRGLPVVGKSTGWIKDTVHFDGFLEEMGEEALEDVLRLTFGIDNEERSFDNYVKAIFKTPEEWAIIAGTIALQGAGLSAAGYAIAKNMADNGASAEEISDVLINSTEGQKKQILDAQINEGMATIPDAIDKNKINENIIRANFENLSEKDLEVELERQEIEEKQYNKLLKGRVEKSEAAAQAKLMGQFFKNYGSKDEASREKFREWFNKTDVQYNVPVEEQQFAAQFQSALNNNEDFSKLNPILQERLPNYNSIEEFYRDYSIIENLTKNGAEINSDGTVTLYHAGNVKDILKDGRFKANTAAKGGMTGYNSKSVFFGFNKDYVKKWSSNGAREIIEIKVPFEYIKQAAKNQDEVYLDGDVVLTDKENNIWTPQDKIQDNFYTQLPAIRNKAKLKALFDNFNKQTQNQNKPAYEYDYIHHQVTGEKINIIMNNDIKVKKIKPQKISLKLPFNINEKKESCKFF